MKLNLIYSNETEEKLKFVKSFKKIAFTTLKTVGKEGNIEVSLTIIDDEYIHSLNKQYRNIDRPTDVLSFAFNEQDVIEDPTIPNLLGDIFISIDRAKKQAEEYGHSLKREVCFLFCHGLLHLLGYDHMKKEDEEIMFGLQEQILEKLKIRR